MESDCSYLFSVLCHHGRHGDGDQLLPVLRLLVIFLSAPGFINWSHLLCHMVYTNNHHIIVNVSDNVQTKLRRCPLNPPIPCMMMDIDLNIVWLFYANAMLLNLIYITVLCIIIYKHLFTSHIEQNSTIMQDMMPRTEDCMN